MLGKNGKLYYYKIVRFFSKISKTQTENKTKPPISFWNHPAGPKTIFFWAPMSKWLVFIAGFQDYSRPSEEISLPQTISLVVSCMAMGRFALIIEPSFHKAIPQNLVMLKRGALLLYLRAPLLIKRFSSNGSESGLQGFWNHPAGPKTIFFWAPAFKWALVIAGLKDVNRPVENISFGQTCSLALTGLVWSRYSLVIIPVNYSLFAVNIFVAMINVYQLFRIFTQQQQNDKVPAKKKK